VGQRYNAPLSVIHRGDFQIILMQALKDLGIPIRLGSRVVEVDPAFSARVKLASGEWVEGDVIICGDGVRSGIRKQMATTHGVKYESQPTGDAAYRILIPEEKLKENPKALKMLKTDVGMRWMGPGGHIMAYPIRNNAVYNMVLLHPAKPFQENDENWTSKGDKKEMVDFYKDWNATVRELLSYAPDGEVMEWSLNLHRPLPSWVENKCVLVGDACHAMLPYVAQGAAQAIEDAAVLTCALSLTVDVDLALQVYELVRKDRGELIQSSALETRRVLHLPDGPAQRERDEAFAASSKADARNPDLWVDRSWQDFMWGECGLSLY
jgi:salicylate hydroxylase